jgi:hypothetical protein
MTVSNNAFEIETISDPAEIEAMRVQMERFDRNWDWITAHAAEVYSHRGKYICVAGQELFVADSLEEVLAWANAAHPEDNGRVTRRIPIERGERIYANGRIVATV